MEDTTSPFFPASLLLESARLRLAPLLETDASDLCKTASSPIITKAVYILRGGLNVSDARDLIANNAATNVLCGIRLKSPKTLIGAFRLHRHPDGAVEVGYWLDVDWHGQGFAKEALNLVLEYLEGHEEKTRVIAECDPSNQASRAILINSGFSCTGEPGKRPGRQRFKYQGLG